MLVMLCELISLYSPFHCQGNRYWLTWVEAFLLVELLFDLHLSSSPNLKYFAAMCISILVLPSNLGPLSVTFLTCVRAKCLLGGFKYFTKRDGKDFSTGIKRITLVVDTNIHWNTRMWSRWFEGSMSASVHHSGHRRCTCTCVSGQVPNLTCF